MNIRARRRLAVLVASSMAAISVGVALAPSATADHISSVSPFIVSNTQTRALTFSVPDGAATANQVQLTRTDNPTGLNGEIITKAVEPDAPFFDSYSTSNGGNPAATSTINFSNAVGGQPANPGFYNATLRSSTPSPMGGSTVVVTDTCTACFFVDAPAINVSSIVPSRVPQGVTQLISFNGVGFARDTLVEALPRNANDKFTSLDAADRITFTGGTASLTQLRRSVVVGDKVASGRLSLRLTNTNGSRFDCLDCFEVTAGELTGVVPSVTLNDGTKQIRFTTPAGATAIPGGSTMRLEYVFGGRRTPALDIVGTGATVMNAGTEITGAFNLIAAAPNSNAYQPVVVRPDGSLISCTCRMSILQNNSPSISGVTPSSVPANSTQVLEVRGSGLARGATAGVTLTTPTDDIEDNAVIVTVVDVISDVLMRVTVRIGANAAEGPRDLSVTNTDGGSASRLAAFSVGAAASPTPTATATTSTSPSATATATATPSRTATATPTASSSTSGSPSATTSPSASEVPGRYVALDTPQRVLDSRPGQTKGTTEGPKSGAVVLDLSQSISGPAQAAVLNVTVTNADRTGFVVVYPQGQSKPATSNVNYLANQTQANEVVTRINPSTKQAIVSVENSSAHIIVDFVGYFTDAGSATGRVVTQTPQRVFGAALERNSGTGTVEIDLTGRVPSGSTSALVNLTVAGFDAPSGFLVAYPGGTTQPATSNVNVVNGVVQANEAIVRLGTGSSANKITLTLSRGSARLIVDVVGGVVPGSSGAQFSALTSPLRVLDTRPNGNVGAAPGKRSGGSSVTLSFPSSIPTDATGVVLNVTTTGAATDDSGFVVVYPSGTAQPPTSNVNWRAGVNQANEVITSVGSNDRVTLTVGGGQAGAGVHLVADVVGYLR